MTRKSKLYREVQDNVMAEALAAKEVMQVIQTMNTFGYYLGHTTRADYFKHMDGIKVIISNYFMQNIFKVYALDIATNEVNEKAINILKDIFGADAERIANYLSNDTTSYNIFNEVSKEVFAEELSKHIDEVVKNGRHESND